MWNYINILFNSPLIYIYITYDCMYVIIHVLMCNEQTTLEFLKCRRRVFSEPKSGRLPGMHSLHKGECAPGRGYLLEGYMHFSP